MKLKTFLLTALCIICTEPAFADGDFTDGYFTFYESGGTSCTLTKYNGGSDGEVTIPSTAKKTVNGIVTQYPVITIGSQAFSGTGVISVTIPNSITTIGNQAFSGCASLVSATIPNSITTIGNQLFYGCSSLASVTIPNSVTSIGGSAFYGCTSLASVTIPNSVTSIRESTFYNCTSLASVTIPNSVTSIGGSAFYNCTKFTSITIPKSITSLGYLAFAYCTALRNVTIACTILPALNNNPFYGVNLPAANLYVPVGMKALYQSANLWRDFGTILETTMAEGITVSPSTLDFTAAGETKYVSVTSTVGWTASSDEEWITLSPASGDKDGTISVTAEANTETSQRTATVSVTGGGVTQTVVITQAAYVGPEIAAESVSLDKDNVSLKIDETVQLTATVYPVDATDRAVTWASSDTEVATVSDAGLVTALSEGEATITVTTVSGKFTAECTVTVPKDNPDAVEAVESMRGASLYGNTLTVTSPSAERIEVYSITGALLHKTSKSSGTEAYNIANLPKGVLIVRGSSGWTKKIVK